MGSAAPDPITVLMPCCRRSNGRPGVRRQRRRFFFEAVSSILRQTNPDWRLLIILSPDSEEEVQWARTFTDSRMRSVMRTGPGLAEGLNTGLQEAKTDLVSILLSDDRYAEDAIDTLQQRRRADPQADFFHTDACISMKTARLWPRRGRIDRRWPASTSSASVRRSSICCAGAAPRRSRSAAWM